MGIKCKIFLEKANAIKPGDVVRGKVNYTLSNDMLVCGVELVLKGKAFCDLGRDSFLSQRISLLDEKNTGDNVILKSGSYTRDYQFLLPENIPYSYYESSDVYVVYNLKLIFIRTGRLRKNHIFKHRLCVSPTVDLRSNLYAGNRNPVSFVLTKSHKSIFKKLGEITTQVLLPKTSFNPGEAIQVSYEVENNTTMKLSSIRTKITKVLKYTTNDGEEEVKRYAICDAWPTEPIAGGEKKRLSITLVLPLAAVPSLLHCKVLAIGYVLRVKVCLPGVHRDARLDVPFLVGSGQPHSDDVRPLADDSESSIRKNCPAYESPPLYWQAMKMQNQDREDLDSEETYQPTKHSVSLFETFSRRERQSDVHD